MLAEAARRTLGRSTAWKAMAAVGPKIPYKFEI